MRRNRTGDAEGGIAPIFDHERVKDEVGAQITITASFFQQAPKAWADHAGQKQGEALARGDTLEAERWGEGGTYRAAGHLLLGTLGGGASGAAGALASATAMPEIGKLIDEADLPTPVKQALGMVASTTLGALAGNTAGAAAAFGIDTHNRQLHPTERQLAQELAGKSGGRYLPAPTPFVSGDAQRMSRVLDRGADQTFHKLRGKHEGESLCCSGKAHEKDGATERHLWDSTYPYNRMSAPRLRSGAPT